MPAYISTATLRSINASLTPAARDNLVKRASQRSVAGSTFLSHSSADAELLPAVVSVLENHGGTVYLDKKDLTLPQHTSSETAEALRRRIDACHKFVLFATANSKDSRWVPWELGYADGAKRSARIAVFPSVEASAADQTWPEREYLGIYEQVVWGRLQTYATPLWMVWNHRANEAVPLNHWLTQ